MKQAMHGSLKAISTVSTSDSLFSRERRALSIGAVGLCSMIAFEAIGVAAGMPAVAKALSGLSLYALAFAGTLAGSVVAMVWSGRDLGAALCTSAALATGGLVFSLLIAPMPTQAFASVFGLAALLAVTARVGVWRVTANIT